MGTTVDGKKRTNSRYRASDQPGHDYYGGGASTHPGWSGNHDQSIERQSKQAIELCDIPEQPISKYHTDILYGDKAAGVIWFSGGSWRVTIGRHDYGHFKTYIGARKFVYKWYSGLDIDPGADVAESKSPP